ncbi:methyltransferase domain-containing protein [Candidatus Legionella polyplacis]|uniref:Methyltransferase domain-containing protein n=1 Tax=Candidatus Legionella polyplacis TaxID=2005262 RepID=A0ABZ2H1N0_9GAMM
MKLNKEFIQNNFDRASLSYDSVASIQRECALILVKYLKKYFPNFYPYSILDLGTGTGYVAEVLLNFFPKSKLVLNDISFNMLMQAKKKLLNDDIEFIMSDMEDRNFNFHDLVISNFSIQWVTNVKDLLKYFSSNSIVFAFTCLLDGTFKNWISFFLESSLPIPVCKYPSEKDMENYLISLKLNNYVYNIKEFSLEFLNSVEFIRYLKKLGANYSSNKLMITDLRKIIKNYKDRFIVNYKVFFGFLN